MDERKTTRQLQAEASREKLQRIVMELSMTRSLDDIRIREICDAAGMSLGNFYQYFESKEAALIYSYKVKDDEWRSEHFEDIADPAERAKTIVFTHLRSMVAHPLCFDTQLYLAQLKQYDEYFFTPDRYLHRVLREAIAEGQEKGEFRTEHAPAVITRRILNFTRGLVYNYCIEHKEDPEGFLAEATACQQEYMNLFLTEACRFSISCEY